MKPRFTSAQEFRHDAPPLNALLLVQLGTPTRPEPAAVRVFLKEFLSDPRVVEIPRPAWLPILHGVILRRRPAQSAAKYREVWSRDGSPLLVHTRRQAQLLRGRLGEQGLDVEVAMAMRYGQPSIPTVLRELRERNLARLLVLPMYPQYAGSTTATIVDAIGTEMASWRNQPEIRYIRDFHADEGYIRTLADRVRDHWTRNGRGERLLMSFHGVPHRTLMLGDPYHCECQVTARLLAGALGLKQEDWAISFQSRLGRARWLEPYTEPTLIEWARNGMKKVDVICPGFVSDCLETLEEINIAAREAFTKAGGRELGYIECPNEDPRWIGAVAELARRHLGGWPVRRADAPTTARVTTALAQRAERAKGMGALR